MSARNIKNRPICTHWLLQTVDKHALKKPKEKGCGLVVAGSSNALIIVTLWSQIRLLGEEAKIFKGQIVFLLKGTNS